MNHISSWLEIPHSASNPPSFLLNTDLEPIRPPHRTWGFFSSFCYWGIVSFNMGSWLCSSSALSLGISVRDIFTGYILGDIVTLIYTILSSFAGLDWHIGYTITQRVVFGIYGSLVGILVRVLLSIVNYGSNCYLGGQAVSALLSAWSKNYMSLGDHELNRVAMTQRDLAGFLIFHALNAICAFVKPYRFNTILIVSCIGVFFAMLGMVIRLQMDAKGYGNLFSQPASLTGSEHGWMVFYVITFWFSAVSPGTQNQCDYSRFSSSNWSLFCGTSFALLVPTTVIPLFGIIGASTTEKIYGEQIWTPTDILLRWLEESYTPGTRAAVTFVSLTFISSQVCYNSINCGFAGGMDLSGVLPKYINITRGFLITAAVSFALQPWNFYNTSSVFLTVMSSFGVVVTPLVAITVCDYLAVRKRVIRVSHAFILDGDYYYWHGVNWRAVVAFVVGVAPGLPGMAWQVDPSYFNNAGIVNFFYGDALFAFVIPFFVYFLLCFCFPLGPFVCDEEDVFGSLTEKERQKYGMVETNISYESLAIKSP